MASLGIQINRELIGNLIILLSDKCTPLYHTKLLKLLYLIDEEAIKDSGVPITWLDYKVWQYGPVDPATYFNLNTYFDEYILLRNCISYQGDTSVIIESKKKFDNNEFSEYDLEIINRVIEKYKNKTAAQLVAITHRPGGLWDLTSKENDLDFSSSIANVSNVSIDMSRLVKDDAIKYTNYKEAFDKMGFMSTLYSNAK